MYPKGTRVVIVNVSDGGELKGRKKKYLGRAGTIVGAKLTYTVQIDGEDQPVQFASFNTWPLDDTPHAPALAPVVHKKRKRRSDDSEPPFRASGGKEETRPKP